MMLVIISLYLLHWNIYIGRASSASFGFPSFSIISGKSVFVWLSDWSHGCRGAALWTWFGECTPQSRCSLQILTQMKAEDLTWPGWHVSIHLWGYLCLSNCLLLELQTGSLPFMPSSRLPLHKGLWRFFSSVLAQLSPCHPGLAWLSC